MTDTLWPCILDLIEQGEFKLSAHSLDELIEDDILVSDVVWSVSQGRVVESYPKRWTDGYTRRVVQ